MTVAVQLPFTQNVTAEEIAASLQTLTSATSVSAEITQTWSLSLSSSVSNTTTIVSEVLASCQAASPSCQVSLVSTTTRRRGLSGSNVQVQVVRTVPSNAPTTQSVPLPATVTASGASLDALAATMTVTQTGSIAEAQALSSSLNASSVAGQLATDTGMDATQLVITVSDAVFPPTPPPSPPPSPPSLPPSPLGVPPMATPDGFASGDFASGDGLGDVVATPDAPLPGDFASGDAVGAVGATPDTPQPSGDAPSPPQVVGDIVLVDAPPPPQVPPAPQVPQAPRVPEASQAPQAAPAAEAVVRQEEGIAGSSAGSNYSGIIACSVVAPLVVLLLAVGYWRRRVMLGRRGDMGTSHTDACKAGPPNTAGAMRVVPTDSCPPRMEGVLCRRSPSSVSFVERTFFLECGVLTYLSRGVKEVVAANMANVCEVRQRAESLQLTLHMQDGQASLHLRAATQAEYERWEVQLQAHRRYAMLSFGTPTAKHPNGADSQRHRLRTAKVAYGSPLRPRMSHSSC